MTALNQLRGPDVWKLSSAFAWTNLLCYFSKDLATFGFGLVVSFSLKLNLSLTSENFKSVNLKPCCCLTNP
jgi:hypothetical protein